MCQKNEDRLESKIVGTGTLFRESHKIGREGTSLKRRENVWFSEDPGKSYKQSCLEY